MLPTAGIVLAISLVVDFFFPREGLSDSPLAGFL
jgi:hypothetical protein